MPDYMTVVLQMPERPDQCVEIAEIVGMDTYFHGAKITGISMDDAITKVERFEHLYGDLPPDRPRMLE